MARSAMAPDGAVCKLRGGGHLMQAEGNTRVHQLTSRQAVFFDVEGGRLGCDTWPPALQRVWEREGVIEADLISWG